MRVTVNGEPREITSASVDALLSELEYEGTHFAIAVNYDVLPKSRWAETMATMSQKFKEMGGEVYLDAEKVKESNRVL